MNSLHDAQPNEPLRRLRLTTRADVAELSSIRRAVKSFVRDNGGDDELAEDFELVVSELSTNVIEHTPSDTITVVIERAQADWVIDVANAELLPDLDVLPVAERSALTGRGLHVVQALVDAVFIAEHEGSVVVRCRSSRSG